MCCESFTHVCLCLCTRAQSRILHRSVERHSENNFLWVDMVFGGYWAVRTASFRISWLGQCHFHESGLLIEERGWPICLSCLSPLALLTPAMADLEIRPSTDTGTWNFDLALPSQPPDCLKFC